MKDINGNKIELRDVAIISKTIESELVGQIGVVTGTIANEDVDLIILDVGSQDLLVLYPNQIETIDNLRNV